MDDSLTDLRAGLAAAIAGLETLIGDDRKPTPAHVQTVVASLSGVDALVSGMRSAGRDGVTLPVNLFHAVVEAAPTAMVLTDERGRIALVNALTEKLFGYRREELHGQPVELLVPERFTRQHRGLRNAFNSATIARPMGVGRDLCGRRKDGTEVPLEIALNPVRTADAAFTLAVIADITERVHAETALLKTAGARQRAAEREAARERECSTAFSRAVLPVNLPQVPGCAFDAVYEPGLADAQVGGDWYDAVPLLDGRILISIGDVSGSGLESAVVVGVVRQVMRGIVQLHADPVLILDAADRALGLEYPDVYASAWVGIIDLMMGTLTYASAGHPPPLVVARDGSVRELDDPHSLLIGLREGDRGRANSVTIEPGDTFVLYTDGVTEAGRDLLAGVAALHAAAATLANANDARPAEAIVRRVVPGGSSDDVAMLVVRTNRAEAERYIERCRFDAGDATAAAAARGHLVAALERRGFSPDECAAAELVFAELIANVVRHTGNSGAIETAVDHGGPNSVLHVLDRGGGFHNVGRLPADPYAENGRGLFLIAALAVDFTVSERPGGGSHARAVLRGGSRTAAKRSAFRKQRSLA